MLCSSVSTPPRKDGIASRDSDGSGRVSVPKLIDKLLQFEPICLNHVVQERFQHSIPVTLNIRSGRIRSCREDVVGSGIAERLVPDRLGWVPGMASMSSRCGDAVLFAGHGSDGRKPLQHMLAKILCQFDSAAVLVT